MYYATADVLKYDGKQLFPSDSGEAKGRFVGFGKTVGDAMTFKVLTDDTLKIIYRSNVRTALDPKERNFRASDEDNPDALEVVQSPNRPLIGSIYDTGSHTNVKKDPRFLIR